MWHVRMREGSSNDRSPLSCGCNFHLLVIGFAIRFRSAFDCQVLEHYHAILDRILRSICRVLFSFGRMQHQHQVRTASVRAAATHAEAPREAASDEELPEETLPRGAVWPRCGAVGGPTFGGHFPTPKRRRKRGKRTVSFRFLRSVLWSVFGSQIGALKLLPASGWSAVQ